MSATHETSAVTAEQRQSWDELGFFIVPGFAGPEVTVHMLDRVIAICRAAAAGEKSGTAWVMPEAKPIEGAVRPEDNVSKVFRLHRDTVFEAFARDERLLDLVAALLGPDLDCFLSQFIFKNPGAMGQPWHQDSYYFPFTPPPGAPPHQVGIWLAVTEATLENGCLWVLPGSHAEPVHDHVKDRRPQANHGYMEIVDHDMTANVPVMMQPGDLLVFDSHLMHRSTDNESDGIRAAMVYHYAPAGTVDHTPPERTINDWLPVRRTG